MLTSLKLRLNSRKTIIDMLIKFSAHSGHPWNWKYLILVFMFTIWRHCVNCYTIFEDVHLYNFGEDSGHDIWNGYPSFEEANENEDFEDFDQCDPDEERKCPSFRNLVPQNSADDNYNCPSINPYLKPKNCLSDRDCPDNSFCCLHLCEGITRCYNPQCDTFVPENIRGGTTRKQVFNGFYDYLKIPNAEQEKIFSFSNSSLSNLPFEYLHTWSYNQIQNPTKPSFILEGNDTWKYRIEKKEHRSVEEPKPIDVGLRRFSKVPIEISKTKSHLYFVRTRNGQLPLERPIAPINSKPKFLPKQNQIPGKKSPIVSNKSLEVIPNEFPFVNDSVELPTYRKEPRLAKEYQVGSAENIFGKSASRRKHMPRFANKNAEPRKGGLKKTVISTRKQNRNKKPASETTDEPITEAYTSEEDIQDTKDYSTERSTEDTETTVQIEVETKTETTVPFKDKHKNSNVFEKDAKKSHKHGKKFGKSVESNLPTKKPVDKVTNSETLMSYPAPNDEINLKGLNSSEFTDRFIKGQFQAEFSQGKEDSKTKLSRKIDAVSTSTVNPDSGVEILESELVLNRGVVNHEEENEQNPKNIKEMMKPNDAIFMTPKPPALQNNSSQKDFSSSESGEYSDESTSTLKPRQLFIQEGGSGQQEPQKIPNSSHKQSIKYPMNEWKNVSNYTNGVQNPTNNSSSTKHRSHHKDPNRLNQHVHKHSQDASLNLHTKNKHHHSKHNTPHGHNSLKAKNDVRSQVSTKYENDNLSPVFTKYENDSQSRVSSNYKSINRLPIPSGDSAMIPTYNANGNRAMGSTNLENSNRFSILSYNDNADRSPLSVYTNYENRSPVSLYSKSGNRSPVLPYAGNENQPTVLATGKTGYNSPVSSYPHKRNRMQSNNRALSSPQEHNPYWNLNIQGNNDDTRRSNYGQQQPSSQQQNFITGGVRRKGNVHNVKMQSRSLEQNMSPSNSLSNFNSFLGRFANIKSKNQNDVQPIQQSKTSPSFAQSDSIREAGPLPSTQKWKNFNLQNGYEQSKESNNFKGKTNLLKEKTSQTFASSENFTEKKKPENTSSKIQHAENIFSEHTRQENKHPKNIPLENTHQEIKRQENTPSENIIRIKNSYSEPTEKAFPENSYSRSLLPEITHPKNTPSSTPPEIPKTSAPASLRKTIPTVTTPTPKIPASKPKDIFASFFNSIHAELNVSSKNEDTHFPEWPM